VLGDVLRDDLQAPLGADDGFELSPLGLELLLALDLLAVSRFLEVRVDLWALGFIEGELRQAALVVDRDRCLST
jgi:hypothetical protein